MLEYRTIGFNEPLCLTLGGFGNNDNISSAVFEIVPPLNRKHFKFYVDTPTGKGSGKGFPNSCTLQ
jgi:hypothetical protein